MQDRFGRRTIETFTGRVIATFENGIMVDGLENILNSRRGFWDDRPRPRRGQVWSGSYEKNQRGDELPSCFLRSAEYVAEVESSSTELVDESFQWHIPERPQYENLEWHWSITEERQAVTLRTLQEYQASDAYQQLRERRFRLDNNRCQAQLAGCTGAAEDLHHNSTEGYRYLGQEPLWCVHSVCRFCHVQITAMDRRQRALTTNEPVGTGNSEHRNGYSH